MVSDAGQSPLVGRLSPDRELARNAAFALFVRVYLEQVGLLPRCLIAPAAGVTPAALPDAVAEVLTGNPHAVAHFAPPERRQALATLEAGAVNELLGWLGAQRVDSEEPQIAYELGMLALGAELPAVLVGALRRAPLAPESRVAELPDGAGYPTVFLSTLHPRWRAAANATLFVTGGDAEQLAGWALLLLTRSLRPPAGSIVAVAPESPRPFGAARYDLALAYNLAPWLASPEAVAGAVDADLLLAV